MAVGFTENLALFEVPSTEFDERLPEEVRFLICELRGDGHKLPDRFVRALRGYVKEAVS